MQTYRPLIWGTQMEYLDDGKYVFLRLEPGEDVIDTLKHLAKELDLRVAALISGVGMLNGVSIGFFCVSKDDYDVKNFDGIFDVSSIQGNITWQDDSPVPHVHMTFNNPDFTTFSGHVILATCHITVELFLKRLNTLNLIRIKDQNAPATQIVVAEDLRQA